MLSYYLLMVETDSDKDKVVYIYENFYSFMCYTAGQVLNNHKADVEDSVHNAMIKIIENIDKIDISDAKKAKNLCGIIAKNAAKDYCKLKDNQTLSLEDTASENAESEIDPDEIVIGKDTYALVLKALHSLDEKYRDVCILKYVHEYKEKEIASLLNISPNTVSVRIYRGKQMLREAVRGEGAHV